FQQSLGDGITAAIKPHILAHDEGLRVAGKRLTNRLAAGLAIGHAYWGCRSLLCVHSGASSISTKRSKSSTASHCPASAKATAATISASISDSMRRNS